MRLGTANTYDLARSNLTSRQAGLADLQDKLSAGKKVVRPSDDPTGAAQAERAMTRLTRVDVEQRALNLQRNSMSAAEATLGDGLDLLQRFRELVINAGDGALTSVNRSSIAQEMRSLRDQIFTYANKQDSNGVPLFGGLGSASNPFTDVTSGVTFNGIPGQRASTTVGIPSALDGQAVWMNVPTGNGVFNLSLGGANTGQLWTDVGQILNPSALTGDNYTITFTVTATTPPVTTYDVLNTTTSTPVLPAARPYVDGQDIQFDGLSFIARGVPVNGDTVAIAPSTRSDLFAVMDAAIAGIDKKSNGHLLAQSTSLSLAQIDSGMDRIQSARGVAGELLKRADIIDGNQEDKTIQLQADRSRAEDIDMIKGISEFQNQQTGYDAALQTYAQIQRLSLFNYLG
ncbi:flagellar hook-associated protein FlgL [Methyloversatilis sp.]|uniref:flagellar hook-associated protein FlgL n=1 Tax=Methyloversatilis sp. TaxID=2569862 RepID=UPI002732447C|nr:flagellar hook-associated protein FlgL [Methyloversatilis sp.]MDP3577780.1 flagellar hook-associated protein FlgL [Methyloversatilis sp.]